ncbi:hypothetical protein IHN63_00345 [Deinococcus sp. 6YEL10]|uniref:hypothetical protein n=1 Tax=Deinococcus sp. 6YEL10 TaxID=2745870 RepID=UPI001E44C572|nr:hypothetical protein [Deinococcus sp. 6YEL10]MCD0159748.1 hypothetical protein [Deinococcus sp. 6YEL10]
MSLSVEVLRAVTGVGVLSLLGMWVSMILVMALVWRARLSARLPLSLLGAVYLGVTLVQPHPMIEAWRTGQTADPVDALRVAAMTWFWILLVYMLPKWLRPRSS